MSIKNIEISKSNQIQFDLVGPDVVATDCWQSGIEIISDYSYSQGDKMIYIVSNDLVWVNGYAFNNILYFDRNGNNSCTDDKIKNIYEGKAVFKQVNIVDFRNVGKGSNVTL